MGFILWRLMYVQKFVLIYLVNNEIFDRINRNIDMLVALDKEVKDYCIINIQGTKTYQSQWWIDQCHYPWTHAAELSKTISHLDQWHYRLKDYSQQQGEQKSRTTHWEHFTDMSNDGREEWQVYNTYGTHFSNMMWIGWCSAEVTCIAIFVNIL